MNSAGIAKKRAVNISPRSNITAMHRFAGIPVACAYTCSTGENALRMANDMSAIDNKWVFGAILAYLWVHGTASIDDIVGIRGMCCRKSVITRLNQMRAQHFIAKVASLEDMRVTRYKATHKGMTGDESRDLVAYYTVKTVEMAMNGGVTG